MCEGRVVDDGDETTLARPACLRDNDPPDSRCGRKQVNDWK